MSHLDAIQARINQMIEDLAKASAAHALPITLHPTPADTTADTRAARTSPHPGTPHAG